VPTAVIGGFLALALGPEGVGRFTDSNGIFPDQTFAVWHALPGLLINVMSASLLLGEQLPAPGKIWRISGSHVVMAGIMSAGQFAVAGLLVWALNSCRSTESDQSRRGPGHRSPPPTP
jgi:glutamate:Na+ symporter, ESS family